MQTISINVGPELFTFASLEQWKYRAKEFYEGCGLHPRRTIAIDSRGMVCVSYREFEYARDRGSYPIRVYGIAEEPEAVVVARRSVSYPDLLSSCTSAVVGSGDSIPIMDGSM